MSSLVSIITIGGKRCTAIPKKATAAGAGSISAVSIAASTSAITVIQSFSAAQTATQVATEVRGPKPTTEIASVPTTTQKISQPIASTPLDQTTQDATVAKNSDISRKIAETSDAKSATLEIGPGIGSVVSSNSNTGLTSVSSSEPVQSKLSSTKTAITTPVISILTLPMPIAQSEANPTITSSNQPNVGALSTSISSVSSPTSTSNRLRNSTEAVGITSMSKVSDGAVVGGVFGGIVVLSMLAFLLWYWCKKRKGCRSSSLPPLKCPPFSGLKDGFNGIDNVSVEASHRHMKWTGQIERKVRCMVTGLWGLGSALKAKVTSRTPTLGVDLNRGNSQFRERIRQHSRNSSSVGSALSTEPATEHIKDWRERIKKITLLKWQFGFSFGKAWMPKPDSDNMSEMEGSGPGPDFLRFLVLKHETQGTTDRRPHSLYHLNVNLRRPPSEDPFADPVMSLHAELSKPGASIKTGGSKSNTTNPFADTPPVTLKLPPSASGGTLSPHPRNTEHHTIVTSQTTLSNEGSRCPSTYRNSLDSFHTTPLSIDARSKKGRSDPFDLERLEIWQVRMSDGRPSLRNSQAALESTSFFKRNHENSEKSTKISLPLITSANLRAPSEEALYTATSPAVHLVPQGGAFDASRDLSASESSSLSDVGTSSSVYSSGAGAE